ncbi:hypothetical protein [Haliangium sp.]|uniref:hypothetical protein n=1 Tax=Haliangium sp. TaxID=2663208 RepID=UPI003D1087D1
MKTLKKLAASAFLAAALGSSLGACAYGGVAASGDNVVVTRNDLFLFGLLRAVYVCQITPQGVTNCSAAEAP